MKAKLLCRGGYNIRNKAGDIVDLVSIDEDGFADLRCHVGGGEYQVLQFSPIEYEPCYATTRDELIQEMQSQFVKIKVLLCDLESKLNLLASSNDQRTA